ncbi:CLUMA_CG000293, isoform A [Clunio marinus]|uniref:CLUMA_CG000293, isoform A n=1 Tax=Clunio marinus TaxID=568069 RepID=A0A1J1HFP5_9DIPT|nr:CLUMA_CG000293, isoform A [Clunio marinus]
MTKDLILIFSLLLLSTACSSPDSRKCLNPDKHQELPLQRVEISSYFFMPACVFHLFHAMNVANGKTELGIRSDNQVHKNQ